MKIEFVNHSSFVVDNLGTRVICDPWLEDSVFNNGWSLLSETKFQYEDFKNIDYIWFSHEHPDHFYPPNIKRIPEEYRANIKILFQLTPDKRVLNFCKKLGFKEVIEMSPDKWYELSPDFEVMCEHFQEGDSWVCFRTAELTYLNSNDCGIRNKKDAQYILNKIGKVDLLLSQFSYAYWVGNPEDKAFREQKADEKLEWFKFQCDMFKPKITIPIASYIYFSHKENYWLNDSINTARKTYDYLKKNTDTEPVVLYNGDLYEFLKEHDSEKSIGLYQSDYDKIKDTSLYSEVISIELEDLTNEAHKFVEDLNKNNSFLLKRKLVPTHIYISDFDASYDLSLEGFKKSNIQESDCDVVLGSESLLFCFKYPYGLDTTQINGRMLRPKEGKYMNFYNFFRINQLKSRGINPSSMSYLSGVIIRKVLLKLGLYNN